MSECPHEVRQKLIDKLGLMTEKPDGSISAPILAWSERCLGCYEIVAVHQEEYGTKLLPKPSVVELGVS